MTNVSKLIRKLQIAVTNIATAIIRALLSVGFCTYFHKHHHPLKSHRLLNFYFTSIPKKGATSHLRPVAPFWFPCLVVIVLGIKFNCVDMILLTISRNLSAIIQLDCRCLPLMITQNPISHIQAEVPLYIRFNQFIFR